MCDATTDRQVAERSMLIKNMMEDLGDEAISTAVPIPNVYSFTFPGFDSHAVPRTPDS